jgi:hypothetical protein
MVNLHDERKYNFGIRIDMRFAGRQMSSCASNR